MYEGLEVCSEIGIYTNASDKKPGNTFSMFTNKCYNCHIKGS